MNSLKLAAFAAAVAVFAAPAIAKEDCDGGFQGHMKKMTVYVEKVSANDLSDAIRKSLDAYNSCKAGDSFSPHGVWDQIVADMEAKSKK